MEIHEMCVKISFFLCRVLEVVCCSRSAMFLGAWCGTFLVRSEEIELPHLKVNSHTSLSETACMSLYTSAGGMVEYYIVVVYRRVLYYVFYLSNLRLMSQKTVFLYGIKYTYT